MKSVYVFKSEAVVEHGQDHSHELCFQILSDNKPIGEMKIWHTSEGAFANYTHYTKIMSRWTRFVRAIADIGKVFTKDTS
jgi:hypothetical protein